MKIVFVLPDIYALTGGNRVISTYAERLSRRGHDVVVISPPPTPPSLRKQFRSLIKGDGWIVTPSRSSSHFFSQTGATQKVLRRSRPVSDFDVPDADIVIATWWETAEWVAKFSPSKGAKVYFVQGYEVFDHQPKLRVESTYTLPFYKITISQWLLDIMKGRYGASDISMVSNGVDTNLFQGPVRTKQAVPTVGLVYTQQHCKGTDISLKAYNLAAQQIPELRLVTFGRKIAPTLPLPSGAEYVELPAQNQLKDLYGKCDAWLVGSREEGFGLPILEAMACRTPVISTPAGAAPEILSLGGAYAFRQKILRQWRRRSPKFVRCLKLSGSNSPSEPMPQQPAITGRRLPIYLRLR